MPRNAFVADFVGSANLIRGRNRSELAMGDAATLETPAGHIVHGMAHGRLAGAEVLRSLVGLRQFRRAVRLDRDGDVVHCYGHGGSGVTLSWGCADDVLAAVDDIAHVTHQ